MGRLAIDRVLLEAFRLPWTHRGAFARALAFPAIAMLVLYAPYWWFYERLEGSVQFMVTAADKLLWIVFAVCCHRLVLIGLASGERVRPRWGHRETVFTGWVILLVGAGWLLALPIVTLLVNVQVVRSRPSDLDLLVATWLAYGIAGYIWARLSPVFPATAIDAQTSLTRAWADTRGNGLRMMVLVFALPMGLNLLAAAVYRDDATFAEALLVRALMVATLAIEVTALSLAYRQLVEMRAPPEPS